MLSIAMLPASTIRSPHDSPSPYLALMGSSSLRALSRLVLSSQLCVCVRGWTGGNNQQAEEVGATCHRLEHSLSVSLCCINCMVCDGGWGTALMHSTPLGSTVKWAKGRLFRPHVLLLAASAHTQLAATCRVYLSSGLKRIRAPAANTHTCTHQGSKDHFVTHCCCCCLLASAEGEGAQ